MDPSDENIESDFPWDCTVCGKAIAYDDPDKIIIPGKVCRHLECELQASAQIASGKRPSTKKFFWRVTIVDEEQTVIRDYKRKADIHNVLGLSANALNYRIRNNKMIDNTKIEKVFK